MDRNYVQSVLQQLNYNWDYFSVTGFLHHVMRQRQRLIRLLGTQLDVSGCCISTPQHDYIFYDIQRHHTIQLHAILHETAHLIMNHQSFTKTATNSQQLAEILLHINMRVRRIDADPVVNREEDEAEYFAFLAQQSIASGQRRKIARLTDMSEDTFIPPFTGNTDPGE